MLQKQDTSYTSRQQSFGSDRPGFLAPLSLRQLNSQFALPMILLRSSVLLLSILLISLSSAMPQRRNVKTSPKLKQELIQQMVSDGEVTNECIEKLGGAEKAIDLTPVDLNRDGRPDYLIEGTYAIIDVDMSGAGKNESADCVYGPQRPNGWIYVQTEKGYKLVFSTLNAGILLGKTYTNGYLDFKVEQPSGPNGLVIVTYKFNGEKYLAKGCINQELVRQRNRRAIFRTTPCK
jgi:hypothetical protein